MSAVEVARRYSDAVKAGDYAAAASLLDPQIEIVPPSGRAYGLKELKAAWAGPGFDYLEVALEDRVFEPDGEGAVMRAQQVYRWKEDGSVAFARDLRARYDVRAGRILRIEMSIVR